MFLELESYDVADTGKFYEAPPLEGKADTPTRKRDSDSQPLHKQTFLPNLEIVVS